MSAAAALLVSRCCLTPLAPGAFLRLSPFAILSPAAPLVPIPEVPGTYYTFGRAISSAATYSAAYPLVPIPDQLASATHERHLTAAT